MGLTLFSTFSYIKQTFLINILFFKSNSKTSIYGHFIIPLMTLNVLMFYFAMQVSSASIENDRYGDTKHLDIPKNNIPFKKRRLDLSTFTSYECVAQRDSTDEHAKSHCSKDADGITFGEVTRNKDVESIQQIYPAKDKSLCKNNNIICLMECICQQNTANVSRISLTDLEHCKYEKPSTAKRRSNETCAEPHSSNTVRALEFYQPYTNAYDSTDLLSVTDGATNNITNLKTAIESALASLEGDLNKPKSATEQNKMTNQEFQANNRHETISHGPNQQDQMAYDRMPSHSNQGASSSFRDMPKDIETQETKQSIGFCHKLSDKFLCVPFLSFDAFRNARLAEMISKTKRKRQNDTSTVNQIYSCKATGKIKCRLSYVDYCFVNLTNYDISRQATGLSAEQLYIKLDDTILKYWLVDKSERHQDFVDGMDQYLSEYKDVRHIPYQSIQELYIAFITYKCLEYNEKIACQALKIAFLGIIEYFAEFYFYLMWRFRMLSKENNITNDMETKYKDNLIKEMIYINIILELYGQIEEAKKNNDRELEKIILGELRYVIYELRLEIQNYLVAFHNTEKITKLHCLICTASTHSNIKKYKNYISHKGYTTRHLDSGGATSSAHERPNKLKQMLGKDYYSNNFDCYRDMHYKNSANNMAFSFVFTTDLSSVKFGDYDIINNQTNASSETFRSSIILFDKIIGKPGNSDIFKQAMISILDFLVFTKNSITTPSADPISVPTKHARASFRRRLIDNVKRFTFQFAFEDLITFQNLIRKAIKIKNE